MHLSLERLFHFRCSSCDKWWSIGDADDTKTVWYCPWCGEKQSKNLSEPDYPKTNVRVKSSVPKVCINFFENDFACLLPTSPHSVTLYGTTYPTAEHAYQAEKFSNALIKQKIASCATASDAQQMAMLNRSERVFDWSENKIRIMESILKEKTQQHPEIQTTLKRSGDAFLGEASPTDHFWATGNNGTGENWLGKIWMKIRKEL